MELGDWKRTGTERVTSAVQSWKAARLLLQPGAGCQTHHPIWRKMNGKYFVLQNNPRDYNICLQGRSKWLIRCWGREAGCHGSPETFTCMSLLAAFTCLSDCTYLRFHLFHYPASSLRPNTFKNPTLGDTSLTENWVGRKHSFTWTASLLEILASLQPCCLHIMPLQAPHEDLQLCSKFALRLLNHFCK